jgi:hypothetical protein
MVDVEQVFSAVSAKIREVVRLMSVDNSHKEQCILKIDSCVTHLNGIRASVAVNRMEGIEDSLRALRAQLMEEDSSLGGRNVDQSFNAPRPLSGTPMHSPTLYIVVR